MNFSQAESATKKTIFNSHYQISLSGPRFLTSQNFLHCRSTTDKTHSNKSLLWFYYDAEYLNSNFSIASVICSQRDRSSYSSVHNAITDWLKRFEFICVSIKSTSCVRSKQKQRHRFMINFSLIKSIIIIYSNWEQYN